MKKLNNTQIKLNSLNSSYGASNLVTKILTKRLGLNSRINQKFIIESKFNALNNIISKHLVGNKLYNNVEDNIIFIKNIRTYKGIRHKTSLPVRGQRTHTNAKTAKKRKFKKETN